MLDDAKVSALRCPKGKRRVECPVGDPLYPGLQIRVRAGDPPVKTWSLLYRLPGEQKRNRLTLGRYPEMMLAEARREAAANLAAIKRGEDPKRIRRDSGRLKLDRDLLEAVREIRSPAMTVEGWCVAMLRDSVAEFWHANTPKDVRMDHMRERVRAFMRDGDSLDVAIRKARAAYAEEGKP